MTSTIDRRWKQKALASLGYAAILGIATFGTSMHAQNVRSVPSATKIAGTGSGAGFNYDSWSASGAQLNTPSSNLFDAQGNQYISDAGNNCVRKVDASGNISTVAGLQQTGLLDTCNKSLQGSPTAAQGLSAPNGIQIDSAGNLYIADTGHNCVRRLASAKAGTANLVTVVGDCTVATAASTLPAPMGLALDAAGDLYVSTQDGARINQVVLHRSGDLPTTFCLVAGTASSGLTACNVAGTLPILSKPSGLALDPVGDLFIADTGNHCVRELTPGGVFSATVGFCMNDGSGSLTTALASPTGLAFSQAGKMFITDTAWSNVYEFLLKTNTLNLIAGVGHAGAYAVSDDGAPAITVPLSSPQGVAVDPMGNVLVVDSQNSVVRKLAGGFRFPNTEVGSSTSQVAFFVITGRVNLTPTVGSDYHITSSTCGGTLNTSTNSTPTTCGVTVKFLPSYPGSKRSPLTLSDPILGKFAWGLNGTALGAGAIFPPGTIQTLLPSLANPVAVRLNTAGDIYLAEAGTPGQGDVKWFAAGSTTPVTLIAAGHGVNTPTALALDSAGNLYIADKGSNSILVYDANGRLATFASGLSDPEALAIDNFDNLYVAEAGATPAVVEMYAGGQHAVIAGQGTTPNANSVAATQASLLQPSGLALDNNGVLYVSDRAGHRVYSIDTGRVIHYLVGNGTTTNGANPGTALESALEDPRDLAVDAAGDLYIADGAGNRSILVYSSSQQNATISTVAGTGTAGSTGDGGQGNAALLNNPIALALDGKSNIYIVDAGNSALREIVYSLPTLDYGTIVTGGDWPVKTVTLWDTGNLDLTQVSPLLLSDTKNFAVDSTTTLCGTTANAKVLSGATCNYGFRFTPQAAGSLIATATLTDNAYDSFQQITLEGTATAPIPIPVTITTTVYQGVYGTPYTWTATATGDGTHPLTGTITFTINGTDVCPPLALDASGQASCTPSSTGLAAGNYPIFITFTGMGVYAATTVTGTATISPAPLSIVANNASRGYGQPNPLLTGIITGVVTGETITASYPTTATQFSPRGVYPITPAASAGAGTSLSNYAITIQNGSFTITQAGPATITVPSALRIYGTTNPVFPSSAVNGTNGGTVTVLFSTLATLNSPVGTYPITAALSGSSAGDYSAATFLPGTLAVTQAPTAVALRSSNNAPIKGTAVTFVAMVSSPSQIIPDGGVTFADGGIPMGAATEDATGQASFTTSALTSGSHTITATYGGTVDFLPSTSSAPQAVLTPGSNGSFSITATPTYQEVKGAGSKLYQITVQSVGGFYGPVTLSCAGLPADAVCAFSPATVTLTAGSSANVQLTATTTLSDATSAALRLPPPGGPGMLPLLAWTMFPLQLSGATLLAGGLRRRKKRGFWSRLVFLLPVGLLLGLAITGCAVTHFHTYTITISGAATSGGAPLAETTTVVLTVVQ